MSQGGGRPTYTSV